MSVNMPNRCSGPEPRLGFVILSHSASPLLARLLAKLNALYRHPPIVIHHDHAQTPLPVEARALTGNISFVRPHIATRWGDFSIVEAFLAGLELLFERHSPDWVANLSANCYPVAAPGKVLSELASTPHDAFLGATRIFPEMAVPEDAAVESIGEILLSPSLPTHTSDIPKWMAACHKRYVARAGGDHMFSRDFACFAGDQWFTANARAAAVLTGSRQRLPDVVRHYSRVHTPDESYCQTVLCNAQGLSIAPSNRRYINWHTPGAHPLSLTEADLPAMLLSSCHFARKFDAAASGPLLDAIDRLQSEQAEIPVAAS